MRDDRELTFMSIFLTLVVFGVLCSVAYARGCHAMSTPADHWTLAPRTEAQSAAMDSLAPECCYSGRVFAGKSWTGCAKAFKYAAKYEGARVLVAREERVSMEGTTLLTLRQEIVPAPIWAACWKESKSTLYLPNGSEIHVLGLDRPERILSARYGFAFVDQAEQLARHQFELLNSRLTQVGMPWHQLFMAFNPENPEHWAFQRYSPDAGDGARYDENGRHFADVVHVGQDDLMDLLSEQSRARLDGMGGVWRSRLRLGLWVAFEGSVYGDVWDPSIHCVDRPAEWDKWGGYPPADWTRYRAIDFGTQNPFVCQWWAEDGDGVFWRYREVYRSQGIPDDWARWILEQEEIELAALRDAAAANALLKAESPYLRALNIAASVSDHDAGARLTLARSGIPTILANKDMPDGLMTVLGMMRVGPHGPRIRFVKGSLVERDMRLASAKLPTCTEEEFSGYRWQKDRTTGAEIGPRDLPIKQNDHGLDAMRYLVHTLSGAYIPRVAA